jgi:predicted acylesterase/phospholipase RssA
VQVGVIKVLEEIHAPVHGATGTGMGAVLGGTYATG